MASRVRKASASRLRRQLRRIPKELTKDIRHVMNDVGRDLRNHIDAAAPKDEGRLADAAHYRVSNDGLGVSVGYSAKKPGFKRKWKRGGFVALWQEFGTKHHKRQRFISPTWRRRLKPNLQKIDMFVIRALRRLARKK